MSDIDLNKANRKINEEEKEIGFIIRAITFTKRKDDKNP